MGNVFGNIGWGNWQSMPGLFGIAGGIIGVGLGILFVAMMIWTLIWKGIALWKAARLGHKGWFVALLLISTLGILDILYIYFFSKKDLPKIE